MEGYINRAQMQELAINTRVVWVSDTGPVAGVVKWIGLLPGADQRNEEFTVGLEFDNPVGSGTGKYKDHRLFWAKQGHASLVPISGLIKEDDFLGEKNKSVTTSYSASDETVLLRISDTILTCPICMERFESPRILPCQHTFCSNCIEALVREHCLKTGIKTKHYWFPCPTCRRECRWKGLKNVQDNENKMWLDAFPENRLIKTLIESEVTPNDSLKAIKHKPKRSATTKKFHNKSNKSNIVLNQEMTKEIYSHIHHLRTVINEHEKFINIFLDGRKKKTHLVVLFVMFLLLLGSEINRNIIDEKKIKSIDGKMLKDMMKTINTKECDVASIRLLNSPSSLLESLYDPIWRRLLSEILIDDIQQLLVAIIIGLLCIITFLTIWIYRMY